MKTIVILDSPKIGYIDSYIFDPIIKEIFCMVIVPNYPDIEMFKVSEIKVADLTEQKKFNDIFFN